MSHFSVHDILNDPNYIPFMEDAGDLLIDDDGAFILVSRSVGGAIYPHQKFRAWLNSMPRYVKRWT